MTQRAAEYGLLRSNLLNASAAFGFSNSLRVRSKKL